MPLAMWETSTQLRAKRFQLRSRISKKSTYNLRGSLLSFLMKSLFMCADVYLCFSKSTLLKTPTHWDLRISF